MQKLPEAPDNKYGRRTWKEKKPSPQKKESCSLFQQWSLDWKHISFLLLVEGHVCFYVAGWFIFLLVAAVSVNSNPRLKIPNNGIST